MRPLRLITLCLFALFAVAAGRGEEAIAPPDTVPAVVVPDTVPSVTASHRTEQWDTTRDEGYWRRALRHGKFNPYDTTVTYPRFLDFCLRVYRWGDRTFNSYDSEYVVPTGKNWKVMIKNYNWLDTYAGRLERGQYPLFVHSRMTTDIGAQISFMAVSYAYMVDFDNLISGAPIRHRKYDFSFTCARFSVEVYGSKNEGLTRLRRFGDVKGRVDFEGLTRDCRGLDVFYIFNHRKYSQAAAYCYSKIQRRSAGSFIAGLLVSEQDITLDFSKLPENLYPQAPGFVPTTGTFDPPFYRFNYREWNVIAGYAYNWVMGRNWLFNVTMLPSIGYKHSFAESTDGKRNILSFNVRGKLGIVRNKGNFFYAGQFNFDGHLYHNSRNRFFNSIEEFNIIAGFRF